MTTTATKTIAPPRIGTIWKAGDGRLVHVDAITPSGDGPVAQLTILNPSKGMRRKTVLNCRVFGTFLALVPPDTPVPAHPLAVLLTAPWPDAHVWDVKPGDPVFRVATLPKGLKVALDDYLPDGSRVDDLCREKGLEAALIKKDPTP